MISQTGVVNPRGEALTYYLAYVWLKTAWQRKQNGILHWIRIKLTCIELFVRTAHVGTSQWRMQDFPEVGVPTLQGEGQHKILPDFPKNCMKLKEFGPCKGEGARPSRPT